MDTVPQSTEPRSPSELLVLEAVRLFRGSAPELAAILAVPTVAAEAATERDDLTALLANADTLPRIVQHLHDQARSHDACARTFRAAADVIGAEMIQRACDAYADAKANLPELIEQRAAELSAVRLTPLNPTLD